ncbi:YraN family protein [Maribrevibacterium harenarium]|nr:YraN family protein [Maribrevibacterium harenarium]
MQPTTTSTQKQIDGTQAEQLAGSYLEQQGLQILQRNVRCGRYEIDLICQRNQRLHFVEVRHRRNAEFGGAAATITHSKRQKCIKAAQYWLKQNHLNRAFFQIDVVAIDGELSNPRIRWLKNITL